jgi:tRNA A-37 threonylcarbamoyl transferase component Bud32
MTTAGTRPSDPGSSVVGDAPPGPFSSPEWVWIQRGPIGWWVQREWQSILAGPNGLSLEEWSRRGSLTTIKRGPYRVVYRVDLPEATVYVKHFLVPDLRTKLRQWVRRGKGRNEGKRAIVLARAGIPTITPIALGEQRKRAFLLENYLVTAGISQTQPLDEFVERQLPQMEEPRRCRIRRALTIELARLTARLHESGFLHLDFHPGNILVRLEPDDRPVLYMIDLDALRRRRGLGWKAVRNNLALLNHYFWVRSERTDRHRFLRAYLLARTRTVASPDELARQVEESTRAWAERLWRRWGRRCHRTNKYFKVYRSPEVWGVASRALDRETMKRLLDDPDALFDRDSSRLIKESRTTTVAETSLIVDGSPTPVIVKRFHRKKWLDPILCLFRPSRGWHAWQAGQHFASRAVPTPANLAFLARRWPAWLPSWLRPLPSESYIVTLKTSPSTTLADYVRDVLPRLEPGPRRRRIEGLITRLAGLIRLMHERSLSHRDLKASNILVVEDPRSGSIQLTLIDLVGVSLSHPLPWERRIQNLARLQVSLSEVVGRTRTDALRFLRAYDPSLLNQRSSWKSLWRLVERRMRRKERQNRWRGRALS